ncbi:MAG TPA: T9SS type A sorting domain-containing protein [Bacteroidia bacterium]|nr:T9SS type A sorting domain-containing protein [Bacteroidia bacterium]
MKVKPILLVLVLQITFNAVIAQSPFQRVISGDGIYTSNASQITSDKGYILAGQNSLVKTDSSGSVKWAIYYNLVFLQSVRQTFDGGYIACGMSLGSNNEQDYTVIRTDSIGDTLWTRSYGGALDDWAYAIENTQDTAYIISGSSQSFSGAYTIKINDNGDTLWTKTFVNVFARSIKPTSDGNFIIAAAGQVAGNSGDAFLIKINQNGDTLWTRSYGNTLDETGFDVIQTSDDGYAVIGATNSYPNAGAMDLYLLKTDSLGNFDWSKTYGSVYVDEGYALRQTSDDGFILAGRMQGYNGGGGNCGVIGPCYDVYLIRTDNTGDTLWTKMYGGNNLDWAYSLELTSDGGFLVTGQTESFNLGFLPLCAYLIKADSSGNAVCNQYNTNTVINNHIAITHSGLQIGSGGIIYPANMIVTPVAFLEDSILCISTGMFETMKEINIFNVYPNPFNDKLNFSCETNENLQVHLYDITARKLLQQTFTNSISINTEQLAKGIYLYEVRNKNGVIKKGKVVKPCLHRLR